MWENNNGTIIKTTGKYLQKSYATVACTIQSEWIFLERVTWYMVDAFAVVDKMLQETLFVSSFLQKEKSLSTIVGALSTMPVKKSGLGLLNPLTSGKGK